MTELAELLCHHCGRSIKEHGAFLEIPTEEFDLVEGAFDSITGLYCPKEPSGPKLWWHVFGAEHEGTWALLVAGRSPEQPGDITPDGQTVGPGMRIPNAGSSWPYLASFDHEPTNAEKLALTPEKFLLL